MRGEDALIEIYLEKKFEPSLEKVSGVLQHKEPSEIKINHRNIDEFKLSNINLWNRCN